MNNMCRKNNGIIIWMIKNQSSNYKGVETIMKRVKRKTIFWTTNEWMKELINMITSEEWKNK